MHIGTGKFAYEVGEPGTQGGDGPGSRLPPSRSNIPGDLPGIVSTGDLAFTCQQPPKSQFRQRRPQMKIGFVGLGIMGSRMAARLQAAGHQLFVFNRTKDKSQALVSHGAVWADTPAAAGQVQVLFTMLAHPDAVRQAALGADGFLDGLRPGSLWVDCSTVNPGFSREIAAEAQARGVRFLDAPVAGTKGVAEQGQLSFFVGGAAADLEECRPLLEQMGSRITHIGGHGMGASFKMVSNLLLGEAMAAFAEGIVLGQSLGIPQEKLFGLLLGGPVVAPFTTAKAAKIGSQDFSTEFPLRWMHKDLNLVSATAYAQGVALPLVNVAKEVYGLAIRQGYGPQDFSAIFAYLSDEAQAERGS